MKKCSLLLAILMTLTLLAGCSDGKEASSGGAAPSGGDTTSGGTETERVLYDDPEPVNMNGYEFVIGSPWLKNVATNSSTQSEKLFHERKKQVEEAYNCKVKVISIYPDQNYLLKEIAAGNKMADVINMSLDMMIPAAALNQIRPLNEVEGIRLNDARWVEMYNTLGTIDGKTYGVNFTRPPEARACIYYNRDLLKNAGVTEDPQDLALAGEWTFDKFREMCIAATKDTNNDGVTDQYGLLPCNPDAAAFFFTTANNAPLVVKDASGKYVENLNSQAFADALNFYNDLVNTDKVVKIWEEHTAESTYNVDKFQDNLKFFTEGKAAFMTCDSWVGNQHLYKVSDQLNYGILPIPMGPNADRYYGFAKDGNLYAIPVTNNDLDKTVPIFNALARPMEGYEGEDWWLEDMQYEYFREGDTKSTQLYETILDSSVLDIGTGIADMFTGINHVVRCSVLWRYETPNSYLNSSEGNYEIYIDAMFNR